MPSGAVGGRWLKEEGWGEFLHTEHQRNLGQPRELAMILCIRTPTHGQNPIVVQRCQGGRQNGMGSGSCVPLYSAPFAPPPPPRAACAMPGCLPRTPPLRGTQQARSPC